MSDEEWKVPYAGGNIPPLPSCIDEVDHSAVGLSSSSSPNGYNPSYPFRTMDRTSPFGTFLLDRPKPDECSCTDMAASLQTLL